MDDRACVWKASFFWKRTVWATCRCQIIGVEIIGVLLGRLHIIVLHSWVSAEAESKNQVADTTSEI